VQCAAELLTIRSIFHGSVLGQFLTAYFSELEEATYIKFGEEIGISTLMPQRAYLISDLLPHFEIRML